MTKYIISKYKIILSLIPIMLNSNINIVQATNTDSIQDVSSKVDKLSDKTQQLEHEVNIVSDKTKQLEGKLNIVNEQYSQILQEYKKQSNKLSDIEQKQDTLQNQIQSSNFNINEIRKGLTNSNSGISNFPKDDTFLSNENNKFAKQHAQNIFSELQNAKTIDERKAIFNKYPNELNFINPSDKMKYISGDLPINQNFNKQLTDNTVQKYNIPVYDNSNLFNSNTPDKITMQQSPNIENNNIVQNTPFTNTTQQLPENILDELQQATTPEARQEILKKYPSIPEIIDNNNIKQYLENGVPFTPKAKEQISAKISSDNLINKLKDPNISKEEKQKILHDYPIVLQTLGNPDNIDQYLDGNIPFPPNFSDELSQNLLADNIFKTLNNPETTPQQRHEILQQYPEIIQMINDGNSSIDREKYNNYVNGNIPFPPILKDSLSQKFMTDNAINKMNNVNTPYVKQSLVSETPELQTDQKPTPFNINNMRNELSKYKSYNTPLKDSNDILIASKNRPNLDEIYNEMSKADNFEQRKNIVNKYPILKNLPGIDEYINSGGQIDLSPIRNNNVYNKLVKNISNGSDLTNNQYPILLQNKNKNNFEFKVLDNNDFPRYSKDDSGIDFIKMSKEQLISELQKCKNTCKLLQEKSNVQTFEISRPTQVTVPNDLEILNDSKQDNVFSQEQNIMLQTKELQNQNTLDGINKAVDNNTNPSDINKKPANNPTTILQNTNEKTNEKDEVLEALEPDNNQRNNIEPNSNNNEILMSSVESKLQTELNKNDQNNIQQTDHTLYDRNDEISNDNISPSNQDKIYDSTLDQMLHSERETNKQNTEEQSKENVLQIMPQEKQNVENGNENQQHEKDDTIDLYDFFYGDPKNKQQAENNTNNIKKDNQLPLLQDIITGDKQLIDNTPKNNINANDLSQENISNETIPQVQDEVNLSNNITGTSTSDKPIDIQVPHTDSIEKNAGITNQDLSQQEGVNNIQWNNINQQQSNEQNESINNSANQNIIDKKVFDNIIENTQPTTNEVVNTAQNQLNMRQNNIDVDSNNNQNNTSIGISSNEQETNEKLEQLSNVSNVLKNNSN